MKTIKKMKYVSPALEVVQIEMEEGIAGGSGGSGVNGVKGWENGDGAVSNGPDDGAF